VSPDAAALSSHHDGRAPVTALKESNRNGY